MKPLSPSTLAQTVFRTSDRFDLVLADRLALDESLALAALHRDPSFYGVLRPRGDHGGTVRAVDRDTALLWLTLREPGPVPRYVWAEDPDAAATGLTSLVLDGVLDVAHGDGFVTGAAAAPAVMATAEVRTSGRLGQLSRTALHWADALLPLDAADLASRLYQFGRAPRTAARARGLAHREAVLAFLGAEEGSALARHLRTAWRAGAAGDAPWIAWSLDGHAREMPRDRPTFKLYVSPRLDELPRAFAAVATLGRHAPWHFKVGADATGVLRPDKLVLYFPTIDALHEAAAALARGLDGVAAHGVPFTAGIAGDGLLSWGLDPPQTARVAAWQAPESWRLWVVQRLAATMSAAAMSETGLRPSEFALERLRLEGVDVDGWTPTESLWRRG